MTSTQRNSLIAGGIALLLLVIVGIGWLVQSNRDSTGEDTARPGQSSSTGTTGDEDTPAGDTTVQAAPDGKYGVGMGDPDAPVKVEIYEDYQCPHCADFDQAAHADLLKAAQDGSAYVVYTPMAFLNDYSTQAMNAFGVVLDAAGAETALKFHHLLFENQPTTTAPSDDDIIALAVKAGAAEEKVRDGIEERSFSQWVVNANDAASKRGVTGTPTIFVNGEAVPGGSIEQLVENTLSGIKAG